MMEDNNCTNPWGCNFTDYDYFGAFRAYFNDDYPEEEEEITTKIKTTTTIMFVQSTTSRVYKAPNTTLAETKAPTTPAADDEIGNLEKGEEEEEKTSGADEGARTSKVTLFLAFICAFAYN